MNVQVLPGGEILQAVAKASTALFEENVIGDATFKEIYESWKTFHEQVQSWSKINELSFSHFVEK